MIQRCLYHYNATVTSVYDGDTITIDMDMGCGIWRRGTKVRLYGIDTPELRGEEREEGLKVRDWVRSVLLTDKEVVIQTMKDSTGKYGRLLGVIFYKSDNSWVNLNEQLLTRGLAKPYGG
jgi:micrococcal nuclease